MDQISAFPLIEKTWGTAQTIYRDEHREVVLIRARAGESCSVHRHKGKHNGFIVLSGVLTVRHFLSEESFNWKFTREVFRAIERVCYKLSPTMNPHIAPAGHLHQFTAETDVVALEIYEALPCTKLDPDDIERIQSAA